MPDTSIERNDGSMECSPLHCSHCLPIASVPPRGAPAEAVQGSYGQLQPTRRPVFNDTHSLTVNFSFSLMQIMDVDEKNQVLTTNIWLQLCRREVCATFHTNCVGATPLGLPPSCLSGSGV
nr:neuronal acetylcholine receptor subunit alpha-3-like [Salvelinus alpinus]